MKSTDRPLSGSAPRRQKPPFSLDNPAHLAHNDKSTLCVKALAA